MKCVTHEYHIGMRRYLANGFWNFSFFSNCQCSAVATCSHALYSYRTARALYDVIIIYLLAARATHTHSHAYTPVYIADDLGILYIITLLLV